MSDREVFATNLKRLMDESGRSQAELAEYVGKNRTTVSAWVCQRGYPRADVMEKISQFFNVRLSDLVMPRKDNQDEARLLLAWRNADPTYQTVALELLETHPKKESASAI